MAEVDVVPSGLGWEVIDEFRRDCGVGGSRVPTRGSFSALVSFLVSQELWCEPPVESTAVGGILDGYREWLIGRGLAAGTRLRYENLARRFLEWRFAAAGEAFLRDLTARPVVSFMLAETTRVSVGAAQGRVTELRALLRYLYVRGLTNELLAGAAPPVAGWRDTTVPAGLSAGEVEAVLAACDRSSAAGRRDLAMLLLVARLGLRCVEVARMELGDIDWRGGKVLVRGKGGRRDRLPLPHHVGEALVAYLCQDRPATSIRQVFIVSKAPRRPIRPHLVGAVCRRACKRAGVTVVGAHRLRHALATEMLRRGASLVAVGQVLRHRELATTAIYAKVDLVALRHVAQDWPEVER